MKSYIYKPLTIKKSELFSKNKIFAPSRHKQLIIKNSSVETLSSLVELGTTSLNIEKNKGYYQYIEIGDINTTTGGISYKTVKSIDISSASVSKIQKNDILISTVRTYLGGIGIVTSTDKNLVATKALIVLRKMKKDISKYYLFGILRSKFFIDQVSMILNASMYPRMEKEYFDRLIIPFPTQKQNDKPKDVEKLVSLITQNIIDKEEQIKLKNQLIDSQIEKELKENQKSKALKYAYPKLSELKKENRLDTTIYTPKYKGYENLILNYTDGYFFLDEKLVSPGVTPKDYFFSDIKKSEKFKDWITPKNIEQRQLSSRTFIYTKTSTKIKKYSLVLNGIRYVGNGIFIENEKEFFTNQNMLIINQFKEQSKQLFLFCFLTSKIGKSMQISRRNFGIVPILYTENLCKIPIPNFEEKKQKEIAKSYYNKVDTLNNISLDNYLTEHKKRNQKLGIFQLNMEIFELKEKLENLVDKIVMDEKIDIQEFF
ncbi:hypothetical protein N5U19_01330 [Aliarcobacter butzleri]|uniref:hypothetical protein n=1 Tax=Aliarcobacter butzleri TaxID=28197 RepID=UPI0021B4DC20|nr:hypothetical protein [Aliarcobacter butzleri]MCT7649511.1 hypothetical protein [Aliarcobacter butzleri]